MGGVRATVTLDESLTPVVRDAAGGVVKRLPRPGRNDDGERATAAYHGFARLKKAVDGVGADRIRALEDAMVSGRTWTAGEFRTFPVEHPLMGHLTRRRGRVADVPFSPIAMSEALRALRYLTA